MASSSSSRELQKGSFVHNTDEDFNKFGSEELLTNLQNNIKKASKIQGQPSASSQTPQPRQKRESAIVSEDRTRAMIKEQHEMAARAKAFLEQQSQLSSTTNLPPQQPSSTPNGLYALAMAASTSGINELALASQLESIDNPNKEETQEETATSTPYKPRVQSSEPSKKRSPSPQPETQHQPSKKPTNININDSPSALQKNKPDEELQNEKNKSLKLGSSQDTDDDTTECFKAFSKEWTDVTKEHIGAVQQLDILYELIKRNIRCLVESKLQISSIWIFMDDLKSRIHQIFTTDNTDMVGVQNALFKYYQCMLFIQGKLEENEWLDTEQPISSENINWFIKHKKAIFDVYSLTNSKSENHIPFPDKYITIFQEAVDYYFEHISEKLKDAASFKDFIIWVSTSLVFYVKYIAYLWEQNHSDDLIGFNQNFIDEAIRKNITKLIQKINTNLADGSYQLNNENYENLKNAIELNEKSISKATTIKQHQVLYILTDMKTAIETHKTGSLPYLLTITVNFLFKYGIIIDFEKDLYSLLYEFLKKLKERELLKDNGNEILEYLKHYENDNIKTTIESTYEKEVEQTMAEFKQFLLNNQPH